MPNIELHNFSVGGLLVKKTKDDIWKALENYEDIGEVIVTEVPSSSETKNRKSAPEYLRVWAGSKDELEKVIELLKPLGFDIEPALLGSECVPGKSEQQKAQEMVDRCAENLKRDLGPYPVTKSKMLD